MNLKTLAKDRRIVIYGIGNIGNQFAEKFSTDFSISFCTSSFVENEKTIPNLNYINYETLDKDNDYLIICTSYYHEIRKKLIIDGWKPYEDFINYKICEQLLYKIDKEFVLGLGQCEIEFILKYAKKIQDVSKKYCFAFYSERSVFIDGDHYEYEELVELNNAVNYIDKICYPSTLSAVSTKNYTELSSKLERKVEVIKISIFHFDSYWPQDISKEREISPYYMAKKNSKVGGYIERDRVVEKYIEDGIHKNEILEIVVSEEVIDKATIVKNHERCMKRIKLMDRLSNLKIYDYVEENYKRQKLFCDRGHFNDCLLEEYVKRFVSILGVDNVDISVSFDEDASYVNEFPIYPVTAEVLGLQFYNSNMKYRMMTYNGMQRVTFICYIDKLVEYCYSIKNVFLKC